MICLYMNLIYFTIGYNPEYIELLRFCLQTLREQCDLSNIKILVMCDEGYRHLVESLEVDYIMTTGMNRDPMQVSMRKVEVFSFPDINKFDKVMYLDSDIIITGDLNVIFDDIVVRDKLYVFEESDDYIEHNLKYFGLQNYTPEDIRRFTERRIKVFNCGQFGFKVSQEMHAHFYNVLYFIKQHDGEFYYEQSFMNYYFNNLNVRVAGFNKYTNLGNRNDKVHASTRIIHYADAAMSHKTKLCKMNQDYNTLVRNCN